MAYAWNPDAPHPKIDADVFGSEIDRIEATLGRPPAPADIVASATSPTSAIHGAFEWDNKKAGDAWRREQARAWMGSLTTRVRMADGTREPSRAFFAIRAPEGRGYTNIDRIMSDADLKAQLVTAARGELERYLRKYERIAGMAAAIPHLQDAISAMRDEADAIEVQAKRRRPASRRPVADPVPSSVTMAAE